MGWVQTRRDHGGVIFVDLRDRHGVTQITFDPKWNEQTHQNADRLRSEFCLGIRGEVRARPEGMKNPKLPTGEIEVAVSQLEIFSESPTPPFEIADGIETNETVRLEYRYLDLRRTEAQKPLMLRSKLTHIIRDFLSQKDFFDIETPFLTKSTPEGARDYVVPSRLHPGQAYALPQSPQLFKQLLMVAGFERYYQIARCFRDEDLRADRQPDFTQLDMEMSFVNQEQIFGLLEELLSQVWKDILGVGLKTPFMRMPYAEAVEKYGSDKPDLRLDWQLVTVTDTFKDSDFKVFRDAYEKKLKVQCLRIPQAKNLSRKDLDDLTPKAKVFGAKGIAWIRINELNDYEGGWQSPISKFLSEAEKKELAEKTKAQTDDILVFCADSPQVVADSLGFLRLDLGKKMGALKKEEWAILWVTDFPLFQWDAEGKRWVSEHHPFTSPRMDQLHLLDEDPGQLSSSSYDIVVNGNELGSGSIRIHNSKVQHKIFELLKLTDQEIEQKFGFFIKALSYGAPPHGGIALGLDRLAMLLAGGQSLREVIAFPKTQRGQCLLTQAPSPISKEQWKELHLEAKPALSETLHSAATRHSSSS